MTTKPRWRPTWIHWTVATVTLLLLTPVIAALAWRTEGFAITTR